MKINRKYIVCIDIETETVQREVENDGYYVLVKCKIITTKDSFIIEETYIYTTKDSNDFHLAQKAEETFKKYLDEKVLIGEW